MVKVTLSFDSWKKRAVRRATFELPVDPEEAAPADETEPNE